MHKLWLVVVALVLYSVGLSHAASDLVAIPPLTKRVTDLTATLGPDEQAQLEARLREFENRKGSQVAVLIVPTTQPESIEQYAIRVAEQWKLGRKKVDDGVILLVAKNDRALRIEVGYGLEGVLNDAIAKRIISEVITPRFKEGDISGGIVAGTERMMQVIDGEALPEPQRVSRNGDLAGGRQLFSVGLVLAVILGGVLRSKLGRMPGAVATAGIIGLVTWFLAGVMVTAVATAAIGFAFTLLGGGMGRGGGWYGGHGHGGFHSGGFGGGGFGGGGGGFGGGGSSGRW